MLFIVQRTAVHLPWLKSADLTFGAVTSSGPVLGNGKGGGLVPVAQTNEQPPVG